MLETPTKARKTQEALQIETCRNSQPILPVLSCGSAWLLTHLVNLCGFIDEQTHKHKSLAVSRSWPLQLHVQLENRLCVHDAHMLVQVACRPVCSTSNTYTYRGQQHTQRKHGCLVHYPKLLDQVQNLTNYNAIDYDVLRHQVLFLMYIFSCSEASMDVGCRMNVLINQALQYIN